MELKKLVRREERKKKFLRFSLAFLSTYGIIESISMEFLTFRYLWLNSGIYLIIIIICGSLKCHLRDE